MKLIYTEHHLFRRFKLNPIRTFIFEPKDALNFIVGTNGSGKTSLLDQWTPLPKSSTDYAPGGYCKQKFLGDDGLVYELRSEFDKNGAATHHFIREGEALNNGAAGGTAKVQKQLVERYLHFDKELYSVLTGATSFTRMTPQQRQQIITEISDCDLSYAFKLYRTIQSQMRNAKGTQKDLQSVIAKDKDKLAEMNIEEINATRAKLKERLNFLNNCLLRSTKNTIENEKQTYKELEASILTHLESAILDKGGKVDTLGFKDRESVVEAITESSSKVQQLIANVNTISEQTRLLDEQLKRHRESLKTSGGELLNQITLVEKELAELTVSNEDISQADIDVWEVCLLKLSNWLSEYSGLEEIAINEPQAEKIRSFLKNFDSNFHVIESELQKAVRWLEHADNHKLINCPRCNHEFSNELDLSLRPKFEESKTLYTQRRENYLNKKSEGEEILKAYENELTKRRTLLSILEHAPETDMVFNLEQSVSQYYHQLNKRFHQSKTELKNRQRKIELTEKLSLLTTLREQDTSETIKLEIESLSKQREINLENIESWQDEILVLKSRLDALNHIVQTYDYQQRLIERAKANIEKLSTLSNDIMRYECNNLIQTLMEEIHVELSKTNQAVNDHLTLLESIRRFEEVTLAAKERQEDLELLADILSPNTGIIAAQLTEHINLLIAQMNTIIENIWEHTLEIQPCGIESGELNYLFPMIVGDDEDLVPDVSKGSKGQREVIDIAFTIVLMMQKDIGDNPMYLDEPASSFDKSHRVNFMRYINELLTNKKVSQVFMINHYNDMYGMVGEHDVIVIDKTNVVIGGEYNRNVTIN